MAAAGNGSLSKEVEEVSNQIGKVKLTQREHIE